MKRKITIQPKLKIFDIFKSIDNGTYKCSKYIYKSGRFSLYKIIKIIQSKKNIKKIYIPNFICREVLEGISAFKLDIIFYNVNRDLYPDFSALRNHMCNNSLFLVVNYFGIRSNWDEINKLKFEYNLTVIEDNSHSLTIESQYELGVNGDFSFNSLRKIIPVLSGSEILVNNSDYSINYNYKKRFIDKNEFIYYFRRYLSIFSFLRNKSTKNHSKEIVKSEYADMFSYNMTQSNKYPLDTLRQKRMSNFKSWNMYLKNKDIAFFDIDLSSLSKFVPYAFPCYVEDEYSVDKWMKWGKIHNISIIKWPKFPSNIDLDSLNPCFKHVLLFPVNHEFDISEILN